MPLLYDLPPVPSNSVQLLIRDILTDYYTLLDRLCKEISQLITEKSKNVEKKKL